MRSELDMAFDEEVTDNQTIANLMKQAFTRDEIHKFLEAVTANYEYGSCPLCHCAEVPVDKDGNEIKCEDVSGADFREVHDEDCLVTWLESK